MTAGEAAKAVDRAQHSTPLTRLLDRISGYDFFISYAHADAPGYAEQLTQRLKDRGFRVFLDRQVYVAGDELNAATLRRVRASSKLIVVVGERALQSHWVLQEVETAIRASRPVIAIDLLGDLAHGADDNRLAALLRDRIHIREPQGPSDGPSESTLASLRRSFQATRREALRLRVALGATLFFAVLAGFSYWQKRLADDRAKQYEDFCIRVVEMVKSGNNTIDSLGKNSEFGQLIADVTRTLAQLPDPRTDPDLKCIPAGS